MVLLLTTGLIEEERAETRRWVPNVSRAESVQPAMCDVLHVTVAVLPLSTRDGLAVKELMTPGWTQVLPPVTCTWPDGHVHEGE